MWTKTNLDRVRVRESCENILEQCSLEDDSEPENFDLDETSEHAMVKLRVPRSQTVLEIDLL